MVWPVIFTVLVWSAAVALLVPGAVLWCIPATAATGQVFVCASRRVAIIASLTAPICHFLMMNFAA